MRVTSLLLPLFIIAGSRMAPAATAPDQAVFNVIRHSDPTLVSERTLYRNVVAPDLDLVIAMGSPALWALNFDSQGFSWNKNQKLGLFLQEKARPGRVYLLALAAGFPDCEAGIERATSTEALRRFEVLNLLKHRPPCRRHKTRTNARGVDEFPAPVKAHN
jgi:hypothetical protein